MTQLRKPSKLVKPELYILLKDMYDNNNLYSGLSKAAVIDSTFLEALKPYRTVVNRSVEFFVAKVFPTTDMLPSADNEAIIEPIQQIATWSNFAGKKQLYIRNLAMFGDLFLKINVNNQSGQAYYESIDPMNVTDFEADARGFLQWIRIDIPIDEKTEIDTGASVFDDQALSNRTQTSNLTYTEYWSKTYFAIWIHNLGATAALDTLGDPKDFGFPQEFGIDFVPFVHIKFRDAGDKYGKAAVEHAIDKIDEANREATRLAQILYRYNKPLWAVMANSVDKDGLPIPAPKISTGDGDDLDITDSSIVYLPGKSELKSLIPTIDYDAALAILNAMMDEIEQDLPELKYYSLKDGSLSGKAISLLLGGALDRASEARGNFVQGIIRANKIALTMGRNVGVFPDTIGNFENGDFDHSLFVDEAFSDNLDDRAGTLKSLIESGVPLKFAMKQVGFSEAEIVEAFKDEEDPLDVTD